MRFQYFDIHSHLQFAAYEKDGEATIARMKTSGVGSIVVGTKLSTSEKAVALAEKHPDLLWATVGVHPIHTDKSFHDPMELGGEGSGFVSAGEVVDYEAFKKLAAHPKVVGIGECGLDYYHLEPGGKDKQVEAFEKQVDLALEVGKPLMLHIRNGKEDAGKMEAYKDTLSILKRKTGARGNVHFYAGNWDIAKQFVELNFSISFTGVITFAPNYDEVIVKAPKDRIMAETDSPYVAPAPHRGKRNEPLYVEKVYERIAELWGMSIASAAEKIAENVRATWGIEV